MSQNTLIQDNSIAILAEVTRINGQWQVRLIIPEWVYQDILLDADNNVGLGIRLQAQIEAASSWAAFLSASLGRLVNMLNIPSFSHDMANFLSRTYHNYLGAVMFQQIFDKDFSSKELAIIMQAIANHDKYDMKFSNPVSAIVVLADKSDVHRSRVTVKDIKKIKEDIHNRVNYATKTSKLGINRKSKRIILSLTIDTKFVPLIEYFEIFTDRMVYCRQAASYLGYKFGLIINRVKIL